MIRLPDNIQPLVPEWLKGLPFLSRFMERRNLTFQHEIQKGVYLYQNNENGTPVFLIFVFYDKMGIEHLKMYLQLCESTIVRNVILIYQNQMTSNCLKVMDNIFQFQIECFRIHEFQYDITSLYYYVPHEKISNEQSLQVIRKKYGSHLPVLLKSDPIVRYFGFKRNDIIKVIRSPNEFIYRQVR